MATETMTLHLPTMHCDGCMRTVRSELEKVGATVEASDIETKRVTVRFDAGELTRRELAAAMEMIGFPPEEQQPA